MKKQYISPKMELQATVPASLFAVSVLGTGGAGEEDDFADAREQEFDDFDDDDW